MTPPDQPPVIRMTRCHNCRLRSRSMPDDADRVHLT
jgi:hypothetical protein